MAARGRASAKKPAQTAVEQSEVGAVTEWLETELRERMEHAREQIDELIAEQGRWNRVFTACERGLTALGLTPEPERSDIPF